MPLQGSIRVFLQPTFSFWIFLPPSRPSKSLDGKRYPIFQKGESYICSLWTGHVLGHLESLLRLGFGVLSLIDHHPLTGSPSTDGDLEASRLASSLTSKGISSMAGSLEAEMLTSRLTSKSKNVLNTLHYRVHVTVGLSLLSSPLTLDNFYNKGLATGSLSLIDSLLTLLLPHNRNIIFAQQTHESNFPHFLVILVSLRFASGRYGEGTVQVCTVRDGEGRWSVKVEVGSGESDRINQCSVSTDPNGDQEAPKCGAALRNQQVLNLNNTNTIATSKTRKTQQSSKNEEYQNISEESKEINISVSNLVQNQERGQGREFDQVQDRAPVKVRQASSYPPEEEVIAAKNPPELGAPPPFHSFNTANLVCIIIFYRPLPSIIVFYVVKSICFTLFSLTDPALIYLILERWPAAAPHFLFLLICNS